MRTVLFATGIRRLLFRKSHARDHAWSFEATVSGRRCMGAGSVVAGAMAVPCASKSQRMIAFLHVLRTTRTRSALRLPGMVLAVLSSLPTRFWGLEFEQQRSCDACRSHRESPVAADPLLRRRFSPGRPVDGGECAPFLPCSPDILASRCGLREGVSSHGGFRRGRLSPFSRAAFLTKTPFDHRPRFRRGSRVSAFFRQDTPSLSLLARCLEDCVCNGRCWSRRKAPSIRTILWHPR